MMPGAAVGTVQLGALSVTRHDARGQPNTILSIAFVVIAGVRLCCTAGDRPVVLRDGDASLFSTRFLTVFGPDLAAYDPFPRPMDSSPIPESLSSKCGAALKSSRSHSSAPVRSLSLLLSLLDNAS